MPDRFLEMRAFQAVADTGSFTAAAAELRINQSVVSRSIARLETRLATTLLHRSTRRVSLTDEGITFLEGCRRLLAEIDEVERSVAPDQSPAGTLRVSASVLFGQAIVALLPAFLARYPRIGLSLSLEDRHVDLIEEKVDVAIRLGPLANSSLIARKVGEQRRLIVASPAYLAQRRRPKVLADLSHHECLLWDEEHSEMNRWPFAVKGATRYVRVHGRVTANSAATLLDLATQGVGITRMAEYRVRPMIRRGELVSLLEDLHRDEPTPVHAVCTRTSIAKPRVRAFVDFLAGNLSLSGRHDGNRSRRPIDRKER